MPAEISFRDGKAEAFTALSPAWWDRRKEYTADRYLTSEEVWGERGVLNFEYRLRPVFDENGQNLDGFYRNVRTDTGATVGCGMRKRYKLVQPRKAFEWMDSLMNDGLMKYASAGVLKGGREIWILGLIPDEDGDPIPGERHDKYILWRDRYDGGGSLLWFPCATRVECFNTLSLALDERNASMFGGLRHSGNMDEKLEAARDAILDAKTAFQKYNADCQKLIATQFNRSDAKTFVETLLPRPMEIASSRSKTIHERKVQAVRDAIRHPSSKTGDMAGTFWQLVNAISFAVDHGDVFKFRGKGQDRKDNRFISLMTGDGAKLKNRALRLALSMAS